MSVEERIVVILWSYNLALFCGLVWLVNFGLWWCEHGNGLKACEVLLFWL